jgi:hypothetical protein
VKIGLVKIFSFLLLLSVTTEATLPVFQPQGQIISVLESEEKNNNSEKESEKEMSKDKLFYYSDLHTYIKSSLTGLDASAESFRNSAFISLPEIPPEIV